MSIEKDIERIAVALETIAAGFQIPEPKKDAQGKKIEASLIPEDQIPGICEEPAVPPVMAAVGIKTLEELRTFVQKYLTAAEKAVPPKTEAVVTFVKDVLCPKFAPKEPKLMKIPVNKVAEAAQMMYDWGLKNDLIVE